LLQLLEGYQGREQKLIALPLRVVCTLYFFVCSANEIWLYKCRVPSKTWQSALVFAQPASTQPPISKSALVAVPTVAGGSVIFVREIVDMVPHASRANGHIATKHDQIPIIWGMGTLESYCSSFQTVPMMELKAGGI
jgi:hypothetical protein